MSWTASPLWLSTRAAAFWTISVRQWPTTQSERRGRDVGSLVNALDMPQPTVSKHLRVLREAGVVTVQVHGPRRVYSLAPRPLSDVHAWLEPYRQMWTESLDALERHLDNGPEQP